MTVAEKAVEFAVKVANDNSHGYDQINRWGNPDYDCSGLVITAYQSVGVPVKTNGATYTGNMKKAFLKSGFVDVRNKVNVKTGIGLIVGDVLLHEGHHTAIYIGNNQLVHASINENGKIKGGKSGDQTGKEICVRSYYNHPWNVVLRYNSTIPAETTTKTRKTIKEGDKGEDVKYLHKVLKSLKYGVDVNSDYFDNTTKLCTMHLQASNGLVPDGICGKNTWKLIDKIEKSCHGVVTKL